MTVEIDFSKKKQESLRPSKWILAPLSVCISVLSLMSFLPRRLPFELAAVSWVCCAISVALFFSYRFSKKKQQIRLNEKSASYVNDKNFVLYLRPFVSSGRLKVPCQLRRRVDRIIMGKTWDLELAISLSVEQSFQMVAVGHTKSGFGAAKIITNDDEWQGRVLQLAQDAKAIIIVPLARPATLWEARQIFTTPELLEKTVIVMPSRSWKSRILDSLNIWKDGVGSQWRKSVEILQNEGIFLPNYDPAGAFLISTGSGLKKLPAAMFNPEYMYSIIKDVARRANIDKSEFYNNIDNNYSKFKNKRYFEESLYIAFEALLVAIIVRSFFFQPFSIPSESLSPNLIGGDYVFVSKYAYGYSKNSLDFPRVMQSVVGNASNDRFWAGEPKRGDIVVFKLPKDSSTDYIKRVIGLPGDEIQMINGLLNINGRVVGRERIADYDITDYYGQHNKVPQYLEILSNNVVYPIIEISGNNGFWDNTQLYTVPPGHFFMMGDNRDNSTDSRDLANVGYVPFANLVGRAERIFFSIDKGTSVWQIWKWPAQARWSRFGHSIRPQITSVDSDVSKQMKFP